MKKTLLSLIIITKNNSADLERCLSSVQGLVDEIILVDTGSTDDTKKIAENHGCKIFDFQWTNSFAEAKNHAREKASGEWIINLDADESISMSDHQKIIESIKNAESDVMGFALVQRNYTNGLGQFGFVSSTDDSYEESKVANGFVPRRIVRLFRNDPRIRIEGTVHDSTEKSILKVGKIKETDIPIHHYGMLKRNNIERTKMYIDMEIKNLRKDDFFQRYQIASQLHSVGDRENALKWLGECLKMAPKFYLALLEKGTILLEKENHEEALKLLEEAELNGTHEMILGHLGIVHAYLGHFEESVDNFRKAIRMNPKNADFYFNLGIVLDSANRKTEAGLAFKRAIELNKEYEKLVKVD